MDINFKINTSINASNVNEKYIGLLNTRWLKSK